ncbi:hypothetical protein FRC12_013024 [Ceratobasidium sp. 428]|nr:hypothetical protein FRC12_013024 [Ceratobasidium sp. 428]
MVGIIVEFEIKLVMQFITYLGRFYEINSIYDGMDPMVYVDWLIGRIPVSSSDRQVGGAASLTAFDPSLAWIQGQRERLESLTPYTHETQGEITAEENNCLIPDGGLYEKTYVFDFDNEVFTIHGTIHFSLHHLPLATWKQYISHTRSASRYLVWSTMKSNTPLE